MPRKSKGTRTNLSHRLGTVPEKFRAGFLSALDGRTDLAKALRANYEAVVADAGGRDEVGHVKAALVERFVWLEAILQTLEQEMAQGKIDKGEALGRWIQAVNALSGLAKVLGVERRSSSMPWLQVAGAGTDRASTSPENDHGDGNGNDHGDGHGHGYVHGDGANASRIAGAYGTSTSPENGHGHGDGHGHGHERVYVHGTPDAGSDLEDK